MPMARLNSDPAAITVRADAPWKTVEEFIAAAKKKPGATQVGNGGIGAWHVAAAAVEDRAGTQFNHVPVSAARPAVPACWAATWMPSPSAPARSAHVQAGKLRVAGHHGRPAHRWHL